MTGSVRKGLGLWVMTVSFFPLALGQEGDREAQKERAWHLVESLSHEVKQWNDFRDRVVVSLKLADLLWEHDEQLARDSYLAAFRAIPPVSKETPRLEREFRRQLRLRVLSELARRDPKLAERLTREVTEVVRDHDPSSRHLSEEERRERAESLIQEAGLVSLTDLKAAAALVEEAVRYQVVPSFANFLDVFASREPEIARRLYGLAFAWARAQRFSGSTLETMLMAVVRTRSLDPPLYSPEQLKELLWILERRLSQGIRFSATEPLPVALEWVRVPTIVSLLKELIPLYEQYLPELLPSIQGHLLSQLRSLNELQQIALGYSGSADTDVTVEELVSKANRAASQRARDVLYWLAAERARRKGDLIQAFSLAEKIQDERHREAMITALRIARAQAAVGAGDTAQALDVLRKLPKETCGKITPVYAEIARAFVKQENPEQARAVIAEAERCWSGRELTADPWEAAGSLTLLVDVLVPLDEDSAFMLTASIISWLNRSSEKKDDTAAHDGFTWRRLPMIGYPTSTNGGMRMVSFEEILARLAQKDFERTLLIVTGLKSAALRALAQLAVCDGILRHAREKRTSSFERGPAYGRK
ncbi:hypothetical protein HRbin10_02401 [bacterium HR10]|nr:hypothetical protein HRbin10_02401 [bacterium HR10]